MGSSKRVTIGYRYLMGAHMVICHSGVDELVAIHVGEKLADSSSVSSNSTININRPDLFGGEKQEGGIVGPVDILFGEPTQPKNSYLQSLLGAAIPAYRGVFSVVLNKVEVSALSKFPKPWSFTVKRIPNTWNATRAEIPGNGVPGDSDYIPTGSANPIHIIYESLTNTDWGLGLTAAAAIDEPSFLAAAQILYDENFGLSLLLKGQTSVLEFIQSIVTHINAVLYTSRTSGLFVIKLIREPTAGELSSALRLTEGEHGTFTLFERPSPGELVNEVAVSFRPQGETEDAIARAQDLASIRDQAATVSKPLAFPGIDNTTIASRVARRELRLRNSNIVKTNFSANQIAWRLNPGDIVLYSSERYGITDLVVRVFELDFGDYSQGVINVKGTQDIFSFPQQSFVEVQPTTFISPISDPVPAVDEFVTETTYWDIEREFDRGVVNELDTTSAFLQHIIKSPTGVVLRGFQIATDTSSGGAFPVADETGDITPTVETTSLLPKNEQQAVLVYTDPTGSLTLVEAGSYAYIDNEIVRVDSLVTATSTLTISRGCLDTVPEEHAANSIIYFSEELKGQGETEYAAGETIFSKALTETGQGRLDESLATAQSITFTGRQARPYPAGQVQINALYYPASIPLANDMVLTWSHRDRTLLLNNLVSFEEAGSGSPEANTTYEIDVYDDTDLLVSTLTPGAATTVTYTAAQEALDATNSPNTSIRFVLRTLRDGLESHQFFDHTFLRP